MLYYMLGQQLTWFSLLIYSSPFRKTFRMQEIIEASPEQA